MEYTTVTDDDFARLDDVDDWRSVLGAIRAHFRAGSFPAAVALVSSLAIAAEEADHHPDIDLRYPDHVCVALTTHAVGGLTTLDVAVARTFSTIAAEAGATSEPNGSQAIEVAIDTVDADRIRPFWAAVLGYRSADGLLIDPLRVGPRLWFQDTDEPRPHRNRFHIDVSVPHDVAAERMAAAVAAGGTLVSDSFAPAWWILADADGNEVCVCTWQGRSG